MSKKEDSTKDVTMEDVEEAIKKKEEEDAKKKAEEEPMVEITPEIAMLNSAFWVSGSKYSRRGGQKGKI